MDRCVGAREHQACLVGLQRRPIELRGALWVRPGDVGPQALVEGDRGLDVGDVVKGDQAADVVPAGLGVLGRRGRLGLWLRCRAGVGGRVGAAAVVLHAHDAPVASGQDHARLPVRQVPGRQRGTGDLDEDLLAAFNHEKVLQDAGIKLSSVASTTYSKSARAMLEALLAGISDPEQLAELAKARMRQKIPQLREALASRFQIEHHGVMVAQLLAHIDRLDAAIANLSERIAAVMEAHHDLIELLCTIPGVHIHAAQVLIAECGLDMTRFPTVAHFASWAGACPGHHESAGRRRSGRTRPAPRWLTDVLTECARAAVRTKGTYLNAHYAQLRGRRGEPVALGAIRHDLLVAYYHVVHDRVPYHDLGPDWQRKRYSPEHRARRLQRQLEALGYKVNLEQLQPAA
ncbi:transposase [Candidatus Solirubrobacter pratensis]|uniref:transposase n=1 Tax=Candidatus Solirubrobacter pratensis TaxID=1298857 RepID=UPI001E59A319|nr:transposase [Candidatus Solirubrobacter pratensis]